jgi:branched-chain amino acid transport system substrate-binding protein
MQLMQVKTPEESKEPWDHHAVVEPIRGEAAWTTRAESRWARWKAS